METKGYIKIPKELYDIMEKMYYKFRGIERDGWEHGYTTALADVFNLIDGKVTIQEQEKIVKLH